MLTGSRIFFIGVSAGAAGSAIHAGLSGYTLAAGIWGGTAAGTGLLVLTSAISELTDRVSPRPSRKANPTTQRDAPNIATDPQ